MISVTGIIVDLNKILKEKEPVRSELIKSLQDKISNDESIKDESLNAILSDIDYNLDFYEPNEEWRKESVSYYGSERLEEVLKSAIQQLKEIK